MMRCTLIAYLFLGAPVSFADQGSSSHRKIAVIGGGIGGGAFSYYWKRAHPDDEVVAFESRSYVGGRLKHTTMHGQVVELGGDAWSTAVNEYVVELAKEMGGTQRSTSATIFGDPLGGGIGVWQGDHVAPLVREVLGQPISDLRAAVDEVGFIRKLRQNYAQRGQSASFQTVEEFVAIGGLDEYTGTSSTRYFSAWNPLSNRHISPELLQFALEPLTRVIYDQNLDESHAFASLVAVTAAVGADQFEGGNSLLVERLFSASGADLKLQTTVSEVARDVDSGSYTVSYCKESGGCESMVADAVIIACPIEHSNISFTPVVSVQPREWRHWYVTVTRARGLNPTFFGSSGEISWDNVLTTENSSASVPFNVLQLEARLEDGTSLWKFFSNEDLSSQLPDIFEGLSEDPTDTIVQYWPYTFPVLKPVPKGGADKYMPIELAPGLIHLNAMESVASAMEGSVIAARNAALLLEGAGEVFQM